MLHLQDAPDVERIGALARAPPRAWCDAIYEDGYDGDGWGHAIAEDQPERRTDLPEAIRPVGLDLPVFDSFRPGDDLREPLPIDCRGDDIHRLALPSAAVNAPPSLSSWTPGKCGP